jgi:hypothetical protein
MADEFKIPEEYTKADYGFSAIDEAEYKAQQKDNEETLPSLDENDIQRAMLNAIKPLEDKIEALQAKKRAEDDDNVQNAIASIGESSALKLRALEEIIMPLLVNLNKTADKEYIYWPNREPIIKDQMQRVLQITRG